jgi:hypothetical protein
MLYLNDLEALTQEDSFFLSHAVDVRFCYRTSHKQIDLDTPDRLEQIASRRSDKARPQNAAMPNYKNVDFQSVENNDNVDSFTPF